MNKVTVVSHQEESRPAARRASRQAPSPLQERQEVDTHTPSSAIPDSINPASINPASTLDTARSVVDRSNNLLGSMWGNTNNNAGNPETVQMIQPDSHNSVSESVDPPNYSDVLDPELPSYDDLGAKQVQIGSKVIVVDKDFQVSTFTNV